MWSIIKNTFLTNRFFYAITVCICLFISAFWFPSLMWVAKIALGALSVLTTAEGIMLFHPKMKIKAERLLNPKLSLGDANPVRLIVKSEYPLPIEVEIFDELPFQLQVRDFGITTKLEQEKPEEILYHVKPTERGIFNFGAINLIAKTQIGLLQRRIKVDASYNTSVYPSVMQMKKYELMMFSNLSMKNGVRKLRRIGHSYEFDQVKNYVRGDDFRSINWKATSRKNELMVNQYEDERSQPIYLILDKSRVMKMPFEEMTLLDYAINSTLVMSNIILQKGDRVGLISFSNTLDSKIKAEQRSGQLGKIMESLYRQKTEFLEADYDLMYEGVRRLTDGRSLLIFFTNFESMSALKRNLPTLRRLNKLHLLVVVFFQNTELTDYSNLPVTDLEDIYSQTLAQKFLVEKRRMVEELKKYGIQSVLTRPEDLSVNTVNKYMELKARGMI
jgi:uncharacterized protein (DUF58 family)